MSGYKDYCLNSPSDDKTIAGICHRKSANSNLPPVWLVYFNVNNLNSSIVKVIRLGGKLISEIISYGPSGKYVIIQDPAGAYCALYQN
jgi:predicted enzyme related to lactoylglutathione lyase